MFHLMSDLPIAQSKILELEAAMLEMPQVELEVIHHFAPGVYMRELRIPAGVTLTSKIHKTQHLGILLSGSMYVATPDGDTIKVVAPWIQVAEPFGKRAGVAIEDVRWVTIHPTDETDPEELEKLLVADTFEEVQYLIDREAQERLGFDTMREGEEEQK